jgi:hypothetical protein
MQLTEDRELNYGYFSQTLLPDYIEEHGVSWKVVYDARGHFEEPHTERRIGCGTIEVGNYLHAMRKPKITEADFDDAKVDIVGPSGNLAGVLFCEKEGFGPLFKEVDLANRYDLIIISTKGVSVTAARQLIDSICGGRDLPLFVLHDFDVAGFMILGTLHRDTRRYQFGSYIEPVDLGLRLEDINGLGTEPAAATKTRESSPKSPFPKISASKSAKSSNSIKVYVGMMPSETSSAIPSTISKRIRRRSKRPPATSPKPMTMTRTTAHEPTQQHRPHRALEKGCASRPAIPLDDGNASVEKPER